MSMRYAEYFERVNLQHIRAFVQVGAESGEIDTRTYKQRIDEGQKPLLDFLKSLYPDKMEYDKALSNIIAEALGAYEDVNFEIGMKIGARLAYQLFFEDNG